MSMNHVAGGLVKVGLHVTVNAPDLTRVEAMRRWASLGNDLLDADYDGTLHVAHVDPLELPNPDAEDGDLVWACDYCGSYSKLRLVVDRHETECPANPNKGDPCQSP